MKYLFALLLLIFIGCNEKVKVDHSDAIYNCPYFVQGSIVLAKNLYLTPSRDTISINPNDGSYTVHFLIPIKQAIDSLFPPQDAWKYDTITLNSEPPCGGTVGDPNKEFPDAHPESYYDSCVTKWEQEGDYYSNRKVKTLRDDQFNVVYLVPKKIPKWKWGAKL